MSFNLYKISQTNNPEAPENTSGASVDSVNSNAPVTPDQQQNNEAENANQNPTENINEIQTDELTDAKLHQMLDAERLMAIRDYYQGGQVNDGTELWNNLVNQIDANRINRMNNYDTAFPEEELLPQKKNLYNQLIAQLYSGQLKPETIINKIMEYKPPTLIAYHKENIKWSQFPVDGADDFVNKFLYTLMLFNGKHKENDLRSERLKQRILNMVSPAAEEEANSAIEQIQQMEYEFDKEDAAEILRTLYKQWIAPVATNIKQSESKMNNKNNPPGIIKHNLNEETQKLSQDKEKMTKTASTHFGIDYVMYGPTEKRICPKLAGKQMGDIVSESTCRYHCIDGIILEDSRVVCGQALFRAYQMDKFSRDYVDSDGNIVGGYLNKRFEIQRNVPGENNLRLKPGQTRRPKNPSWGSIESRMQDMLYNKGEERGYEFQADVEAPFDFNKDYDKSNIKLAESKKHVFNLSKVSSQNKEAIGVDYEKNTITEICPNCFAEHNHDECFMGKMENKNHYRCIKCGSEWDKDDKKKI